MSKIIKPETIKRYGTKRLCYWLDKNYPKQFRFDDNYNTLYKYDKYDKCFLVCVQDIMYNRQSVISIVESVCIQTKHKCLQSLYKV